MNKGAPGCDDEHLAEVLGRVVGVRDLLDAVLWAETDPVTGISTAIAGLQRALTTLVVAGMTEEEP